jgi:arylsulfatase A-like enzyme
MALRKGDWKVVQYNVGKNPPGNFELYNLKDDPSETNNLTEKYPRRAEQLEKIMLSERVPNKDFPFPLDGKKR